jgi:hypothetical protein
VSALAHIIESRGIATVVLGLVRPHMEKTKPPRGLWVPFPLGRPLGEPEDKAFQLRVLAAALGLLERRDGPVLLVDFPEDAPSMTDTPGWAPQVELPRRPAALPDRPAGWAAALAAELAAVIPHWKSALARFGRTTVGNSRLATDAWTPFAIRFLTEEIPESVVSGLSPVLLLRYIADDLKALYMEAVQVAGPAPSSAQVNRWFWYETLAADLLRALRAAAIASQHTGFNTAGSRFLVPAPFVTQG